MSKEIEDRMEELRLLIAKKAMMGTSAAEEIREMEELSKRLTNNE